jgi:hypothetical protein
MKSGKEIWEKKFPATEIEIKSDIMLSPPSNLKSSIQNPNQKLSVIIIGGGSVVGRMPFLSWNKHCVSYRNLYSGLLKMRRNVNIFFKARGRKGHLDSFSWFQKMVGDSVNWQAAFDHVLQIEYPNMILISVSYGSSALLEGIGRGIPAMIVRDFKIEDYTTIDTTSVPTGSTDYILQEIINCTDYEYRRQLIQKQMAYYCEEIGINDLNEQHH